MNLMQKMTELQNNNNPYVLATVVKTEGSVPGKIGFKILLEPDGQTLGTVGGGAIEQEVISECLKRLKSGTSGLEEYVLADQSQASLRTSPAKTIPMMCHGKVWIFYEVSHKLTSVYIFGGGHCALPLARLAVQTGFQYTIIEDREEFASEKRFPEANDIRLGKIDEIARDLEISDLDYVAIVTRNHELDYLALRQIIMKPARYIGLIGSKSKRAQIFKNLKNDGISQKEISRVHTPIGIDINAETPQEIAISILAEIIKVKNS